ncbi:hypothetical protein CLCAR_1948 [Clostridium carboxidivorans P7]|nr:hypothetical protein CLCAR_1948 [Clostridium carboxidivorans P7]
MKKLRDTKGYILSAKKLVKFCNSIEVESFDLLKLFLV